MKIIFNHKRLIALFSLIVMMISVASCGKPKSLEIEWADIFYNYIKDNVKSEHYCDSDCEISFIPLKNDEKPIMVAKYNDNDMNVVKLHKISGDNKVETFEVFAKEDISVSLIYNRQSKESEWYAVYKDGEKKVYKNILKSFENITDESVACEYSFTEKDMQENSADIGITEFEKIFAETTSPTLNIFKISNSKEIYETIKAELTTYKSFDEVLNDNIKSEISSKVKQIEEKAAKFEEERKKQEELKALFDNTYWSFSFSQSNGGSYCAKFNMDGTFLAIHNSDYGYNGTYTYSDGILKVSFDGYDNIAFEAYEKGFISVQEYQMQIGTRHYYIDRLDDIDYYNRRYAAYQIRDAEIKAEEAKKKVLKDNFDKQKAAFEAGETEKGCKMSSGILYYGLYNSFHSGIQLNQYITLYGEIEIMPNGVVHIRTNFEPSSGNFMTEIDEYGTWKIVGNNIRFETKNFSASYWINTQYAYANGEETCLGFGFNDQWNSYYLKK